MISTHILDLATGQPAAGVQVTLEKDGAPLKADTTNADGRIAFQVAYEPGTYRLTFGVAEYARRQGMPPFFLDVPITFEVTDTTRKYHVPLLLSPYGFSTYRGS